MIHPQHTLFVRGKVRRGLGRGKKLGYPTINLPLAKQIPLGIYVSKIKAERKIYSSLTFVGNATTFEEKDVKIETYILDFSNSLYGKWVSIYLLKKIRTNKKFSSEKELVQEMNRDKKIAQEYFLKEEAYV